MGLAMSSVPRAAPPMMSNSGRLHQHQQVALFHEVAAEHRAEDDNDSEDGEHARDTPLEGMGRRGESAATVFIGRSAGSMRRQLRDWVGNRFGRPCVALLCTHDRAAT